MQFLKEKTNYDFMGKRKAFLTFSAVAVLISVLATVVVGPKFGIDFVGGTEIQVSFPKATSTEQVRSALKEMGFPGSDVVTFGAHESEYLIRLQAISPVTDEMAAAAKVALEKAFSGAEISRFNFSPGGDKLTIRVNKPLEIAAVEKAVAGANLALGTDSFDEPKKEEVPEKDAIDEEGEEESAKKCSGVTCTWPNQAMHVFEINLSGVSERVMSGLREKDFGVGAIKMRSEWVGPKVGQQLRVAGVSSIAYALLFIMIYIAVRFDLRFAPGAVVALLHDVLITIGIFTLARVEVTLATVAALLTIVGYSLNDTIVVFDRIRENLSKIKERKMVNVVNTSINETLSRTILTSLTTLMVVMVILTIGWKTTIRDFAFALFIGVLVGTYSSIFIASPIVVWLDERFSKNKA